MKGNLPAGCFRCRCADGGVPHFFDGVPKQMLELGGGLFSEACLHRTHIPARLLQHLLAFERALAVQDTKRNAPASDLSQSLKLGMSSSQVQRNC